MDHEASMNAALAATSVENCYQCGKCTAGCPAADEMDFMPNQVLRLVQAGDFVARPDHRITFTPAQQARVGALLSAFRRQPATPPSMADSIAMTDAEIISALLYQGVLVRLSEDVLLLGETYEAMVAGIVAHIKAHGSMTVAQVRDQFNTSRKYALALMERLDELKITRRVGDERVLR